MNVSDIDFGIVLEKLPSSPSGCCSAFVALNEKIGLKLFSNYNCRDRTYKFQELAAECELGPEVFGTVDNLNFSGYNCGYLSEIVELVDRYSDEGVDFYNENISGLRDSLYQEIGFQFCDDWIFNVGIKNGRLICIDFGELQ